MADGKKSDTDSGWCIIPKLPFENVEEQMSVHDAMHIDMDSMKRNNLLPIEIEIQPMNGAGPSVERKMQSTDKMEQFLDEEFWRSTAHSIERKGESTCEEELHRIMQLYQEILDTDKPKVQNSCPNGDQNLQLPVVDDREVIGTLSDVGSEGSSDGFDFIDDCEKFKVVSAEQALSIVPQQTARESIVNTILQQESLDILRQESISNNIPEQESIGNDIPQHKSVGNNIPQQKLGDDDARTLKSVDEVFFKLQASIHNSLKKLSMDSTYHKKSDNIPCESVNNVVKLEPLNSAVQRDPVTALPINQKLQRQRLPIDDILSCQSVADSALLQESLDQREETVNSNVQQKLVGETELEKLKIANKKVIAEVLACMKKFQSLDRKAIKRSSRYQKPTGLWTELMDALLPTLGILSLMLLLLHFFFGCAKPAPNLEASLDLIQSSIVSCFGEQYLINIKTGHNEFSNSALCVHNVEKYVAIIDEYLDDHVLQFLEAGIKNPEDPVFRSFADNHTAIDLQIITKQLQYFALLPDMKGNLTAVEIGKAEEPRSGNDAMEGMQAIFEFLVSANILQEHRAPSIRSKSEPEDDSSAENDEGHAVRTLIKEIESLNKKNAIYMWDIETYYQKVKPLVDRLNLTIKPVLLKNVETHPKDVNNNFVLNLLDEVLTMHDSFSDEYFDIKRRTVRLEHLVNRVVQASEVNGKGALLFFLNNMSNETSKAFQTIHDSFLCFANYGNAQKTSECLAENLESMLQITYAMLLNLSEFLQLILRNTFIFKYFTIIYFVILPLTLILKWCW